MNKKINILIEKEIKEQKYIIRTVKLEDNFLSYTDIEKKIVYFNIAKKEFDNDFNKLFIYAHELQHIIRNTDGMLVSLETSLENPKWEDVEAFWYILRKLKNNNISFYEIFTDDNIMKDIIENKITDKESIWEELDDSND